MVDNDGEREHTTIVETGGGGGGGGVLAVVLLIIVVLVLLYIFRGRSRLRRQARPISTFPTRSTSTSITPIEDDQFESRAGCESLSGQRARFPWEPRPFACDV